MEMIAEGLALAAAECCPSRPRPRRMVEQGARTRQRLPGFGHRVHSTDPRTAILFDLARSGRHRRRRRRVCDRRRTARSPAIVKPLPINIDGALAAVLHDMGFAPAFGRFVFLIGRIAGLTAEVAEELTREKPMRIRIPVEYDGVPPRAMDSQSCSPPTPAIASSLFGMSLAVLAYIDRTVIAQAAPLISADLGFDKIMMGTVLSAFLLGYGLFEIPGGWYGDWVGARKGLMRIVLAWSAFTAMTGAAWSFTSMIVIRFLFGVGEAGCFPIIAKSFTTWLPRSERTRAQGLLWMAARWGGAFTPLLVVWVLQFVNWRAAFVLFGLLGTGVGGLLLPLVSRQSARPSVGQRRRTGADARHPGHRDGHINVPVGQAARLARPSCCSPRSTTSCRSAGISSSPGCRRISRSITS